jgi:hypothetical protein
MIWLEKIEHVENFESIIVGEGIKEVEGKRT